jgi:hypothetical protein
METPFDIWMNECRIFIQLFYNVGIHQAQAMTASAEEWRPMWDAGWYVAKAVFAHAAQVHDVIEES